MLLTYVFQFGIDQEKKVTTQTLFLINKNVMEISYVVSAPKHFSVTSGSDCELLPACLCSQWEHFFQHCQQLLFPLWGGQRLSLILAIKKALALKCLPGHLLVVCLNRVWTNTEVTWSLTVSLPAAYELMRCLEKGCHSDWVAWGWQGGETHSSPQGACGPPSSVEGAEKMNQCHWFLDFGSPLCLPLMSGFICEEEAFLYTPFKLAWLSIGGQGKRWGRENERQPSFWGLQDQASSALLRVSSFLCHI